MVAAWLSRRAPGWLSPGCRVYAIGDVHGCADRLWALHEQIAEDLQESPVERPLLLHLGDYVDRGPNSADVVRRLAAGPALLGVPMVCLRGNHEQMLLDALEHGSDVGAHWLRNGGDAALKSWGSSGYQSVEEWRAALSAELPFLRGLALHHRVDGYVFVHAGLRPGIMLSQQSEEDLLWIREDFLSHTGPILPDAPGMAVVHGHTPRKWPDCLGQRVGLDTGAVAGGVLTCGVFENQSLRFLTA
ncbi:metallophosphoesterase family protein [Acidisphaera sp. L21]|uniref:metallophosphoesterase family protein n=1 Tax=Acidisphaera sp. L21 TaxID=1641851 RepID=UPI00131AFF70|nr:metallophosphoesterase family protein [Acidisphaera sp. L21]